MIIFFPIDMATLLSSLIIVSLFKNSQVESPKDSWHEHCNVLEGLREMEWVKCWHFHGKLNIVEVMLHWRRWFRGLVNSGIYSVIIYWYLRLSSPTTWLLKNVRFLTYNIVYTQYYREWKKKKQNDLEEGFGIKRRKIFWRRI